jgi:hypothetical protein
MGMRFKITKVPLNLDTGIREVGGFRANTMIYLGQIYLAPWADGYARPGAAAPNLAPYTGFSENCRSGVSYPPCRTQSARQVRIPRHPSPSYPQGVLREGDGVNGLHSVTVSSQ